MTEPYLAILEYQAGNQTSVLRALNHLQIPARVTDAPRTLKEAAGVIFPGVGAAGRAMEVLRAARLDALIRELVELGKPFLGLCLGCQIMLERSQENDAATLGIFPGESVRFANDLKDEDGRPIAIPHMGWNTVAPQAPCPLWEGIAPDAQFYFVHGYYPVPPQELVMGTTYHGLEFASAFGRGAAFAVQFHPEKSGPPGLRLLSNFHQHAKELAHA
ncbi:MAG: imidazole glycerol phosphate synthase subunit HisH [Deltaproteobacteria bacterium]|jgi:glutamine amidotransferase|nr:imidazole glycerol phosphate synthase subunit HisH [Deltaproteobacteria bacterium]